MHDANYVLYLLLLNRMKHQILREDGDVHCGCHCLLPIFHTF